MECELKINLYNEFLVTMSVLMLVITMMTMKTMKTTMMKVKFICTCAPHRVSAPRNK